jgi:hypothetical protein
MPLKDGDLPLSPLTARIVPAPYPGGGCPQTPADLQKWFGGFSVEFNFEQAAFAYTAGTIEAATPESRTLPRMLFDPQGRFLGLAVWDTNLGKWSTGGVVGELKTIVRTAATLAEDMEQKGFTDAGWHLANGGNAPIPDLTGAAGFFSGAGPDYAVYTVGYLGT